MIQVSQSTQLLEQPQRACAGTSAVFPLENRVSGKSFILLAFLGDSVRVRCRPIGWLDRAHFYP
jgi:hypothetical protein